VPEGLKLMAWGLLKKIVIADRMAVIVNLVYADPYICNSAALFAGVLAFTFQIYCDFSGYSDIAIGAAKVMGFRLMNNFNQPYYAVSIADFWKRWHISLSTWFRDYVFLPVTNFVSRKIPSEHVLFFKTEYIIYAAGIAVTWPLTGLWHGAGWTYILWGALNGFYLCFSVCTKGTRKVFVNAAGLTKAPALLKTVRILITFGLTCLTWVFFRAKSASEAVYIIKNMLPSPHEILFGVGLPIPREEWLIAAGGVAVLEFAHYLQRRDGDGWLLGSRPVWVRWPAYLALLFGILIFGMFKETRFIYFQF
jgi:D-alanyl-lipoteichoic acid acyltransferase DltB (MBOAT superfamily)